MFNDCFNVNDFIVKYKKNTHYASLMLYNKLFFITNKFRLCTYFKQPDVLLLIRQPSYIDLYDKSNDFLRVKMIQNGFRFFFWQKIINYTPHWNKTFVNFLPTTTISFFGGRKTIQPIWFIKFSNTTNFIKKTTYFLFKKNTTHKQHLFYFFLKKKNKYKINNFLFNIIDLLDVYKTVHGG